MLRVIYLGILYLMVSACGAVQYRFNSSEDQARTDEASNLGGVKSFAHTLRGWTEGVTLQIHEEMPQEVEQAARAAAESWNQAIGREVLSIGERVSQGRQGGLYDSLNNSETVIYFEYAWKKTTTKSEGVLATTIWENAADDRSRVAKGDIIMNAEIYEFTDTLNESFEPVDPRRVADSQTVLLHEMGHLLGLKHVPETTDARSVMNPQTNIGMGWALRNLSEIDIRNIREIYN